MVSVRFLVPANGLLDCLSLLLKRVIQDECIVTCLRGWHAKSELTIIAVSNSKRLPLRHRSLLQISMQ